MEDAVLKDLAYFFREAGGLPARVTETARLSRDVTERWKAEFKSPRRAHLVVESDDGDGIRIRDTRACATASNHTLRGRLAALFRIVESPITLQGILARLQEDGSGSFAEQDAIDSLAELRARHLIWRSSTQYVALATPPPQRGMPNQADSVVGKVDMARYLAEKVRFRLAFTG
jgi:hypothetical protein